MLKFALVGCGRISKRHSELLGYNQIKGAELVALCDVSFSKAKRISDLFKISAYDDMDKMMQNETIDVVVVLTPSGLHSKHVINLAKYGKDIMVEKPMALTAAEGESMKGVAEESGRVLMVGHLLEYHHLLPLRQGCHHRWALSHQQLHILASKCPVKHKYLRRHRDNR